MYTFEIEGAPVAWKAHGGYGRRAFNPRHAEKEFYQLQIKKQYKHNLPLTIAIRLDLSFFMPIPKSISKKSRGRILEGRIHHIRRPDASNLVKFVEDTLKGIVIKDDSQVVEINARKLYSEAPHTIVHVDLA